MGSCHYINGKFSCTNHNFILESKEKINVKYYFYILKLKFNDLLKLYHGQGLKNLSQKNLLDFKLPILPVDKQNKLVEEFDKIFNNYEELSQLIELYSNIDFMDLLINGEFDKFRYLNHTTQLSNILINNVKKNKFEKYKEILKYTDLLTS
jgi:restriction endonuclease S subunit